MKKTLYDLLGIRPNASSSDIEAAYKNLRTQLDPDAPENTGNPEVELRAKAIREAYDVLSDQNRRNAYDASLAYSVLDIEPPEKKSRWNTNKILIYSLSGLIGFMVINQAVVQWRALQLSKAAVERAEAYNSEVAERERMQEMGGMTAAEQAAAAEERKLRMEEERRERQARYEEERQRREMEEARRYGARISADVARAEEAAERRKERELQQQEAAQRYEQEKREREAMQRLEAEKRRLRELEYQNRR